MNSKSIFNLSRNFVICLFFSFIGTENQEMPIKIKDWKKNKVQPFFFFLIENLNNNNCIILIGEFLIKQKIIKMRKRKYFTFSNNWSSSSLLFLSKWALLKRFTFKESQVSHFIVKILHSSRCKLIWLSSFLHLCKHSWALGKVPPLV